MKVNRVIETETNCFKIGDQIHVSHYTATCQEVTSIAAIFLLDQYLDKPMVMNVVDTNNGGYEESDLRKALQSDEVLDIFADIRDHMVPFDNGDLLRIPFAGELFEKLPSWCAPDSHEQWPLMQDRRNRLASRCGDYELGWINNKRKSSSKFFCYVADNGLAGAWLASGAIGVRPVFQISMRRIGTKANEA